MALGLGLGIQCDNKVSSEAFSLTNIAGLQLWAKNKTGVTTGATLTWADQSGNGNDFTQAIANAQPAYNASDGGFDFSGSNNAAPIYMDMPNPGLSFGAFAAFYVLELNVSGTNEFYGLNQLDSDANNNIIQLFGNDTAMFGYVYGGPGAADRVNALPLTNNRPTAAKFVLTVRKDSGSRISFQNNQSIMAASTTFSSAATVDFNRIGYRLTGGRSVEGICYETAYYDTSLSDEDTTSVINDLMTRNSI
tara:strand:+ start:3597 stop:4343 length:747 start_codon:yes stop_codon:yes gene_type:complete